LASHVEHMGRRHGGGARTNCTGNQMFGEQNKWLEALKTP